MSSPESSPSTPMNSLKVRTRLTQTDLIDEASPGSIWCALTIGRSPSGHPIVESGHSALENHVSRTSGSRV